MTAVGFALCWRVERGDGVAIGLTTHDRDLVLDGLAIGWVRRSRAGWSWGDGAEVPLAEETERYRATLTAAGGARTFDVTAPRLALSAAERPHGMTTVRIVQQGTLASSPAAEFTFDAGG